jgi:FtsP/CotA-like multicopper oxidase with cupredoxin domain
VNGRELPTLRARAGVPLRLRIVNAAKSRYFELDPDGSRFITVGGDGGLQESAVESSTLVIAPGERLDTIFLPRAKTGNELIVDWRLFNRGYGSVEARIPLGPLFTIVLEGKAGAQAAAPQDIAAQEAFAKSAAAKLRRTVAPIDTAGAKEVRVDLTIEQRADGAFEYGINGVPFQKDRPFTARLGETQIWNLVNETSWSHPFHLHGFFFQVLDEDGVPVKPLVWKDTVDVPFKSSRRIVVRFEEDRPGAWMFHCHVLDHADGGLMGTVIVGDVPGTPTHQH